MFKMRKIIIAWFLLAFVSVVFVMIASRTKPVKLPSFEPYAIGSQLDTERCTIYNIIPYYVGGWYEQGGQAAYCDIGKLALFPPFKEVHLMLNGGKITSAAIYLYGINIQSFIEEWGQPKKVRNWKWGWQFVWDGAIVYLN